MKTWCATSSRNGSANTVGTLLRSSGSWITWLREARYHVFAWEEPFVGHDAIRDELLRQAPGFRDTREEIVNVASVGQTVFVERRDWVTMNDERAGFTS